MSWLNNATVKTKETKEAEAKEAKRAAAKAKRDAALAGLTHTFKDGRTIQTRLQDQALIQGAIVYGGDDWVLADNSVAFVSDVELAEALEAAAAKVKAIFKEYRGAIC